MDFYEKIAARSARIGVVGLGHVGLPLLQAFVDAGFRGVGIDRDREKVAALRDGISPIDRVSSEWLAARTEERRVVVTAENAALAEVDAVAICVPTPLTKAREPDLAPLREAASEVGRHGAPGALVVVESTSYPGTTEDVVRPLIEAEGRRLGRDVFLAHSPAREDPGNPEFRIRSIPKVVAGVDADSTSRAKALYSAVVGEVVIVSSPAAAEATKILENIYRSVNIALVNELKVVFDRMGVDIWEAIGAASTKPFGFHAFYPGPGLGGPCIPVDPFYLAWKAREFDRGTRFIELAGEVNMAMPHFVVEKVSGALNERRQALRGSRGLVIGLAYKRNIRDVRGGPAFRIIELLAAAGVDVVYHDPHVASFPSGECAVEVPGVPLADDELRRADFVVIVTDHDDIDWAFVVEHARLVIDTRNATRAVREGRDRIVLA